MRRTVRCSVIVLPDGFNGTAVNDDGTCGSIGDRRVINCLRSLSTVT
jgi:hypothetical protein